MPALLVYAETTEASGVSLNVAVQHPSGQVPILAPVKVTLKENTYDGLFIANVEQQDTNNGFATFTNKLIPDKYYRVQGYYTGTASISAITPVFKTPRKWVWKTIVLYQH
jgi:hypothetical protein